MLNINIFVLRGGGSFGVFEGIVNTRIFVLRGRVLCLGVP